MNSPLGKIRLALGLLVALALMGCAQTLSDRRNAAETVMWSTYPMLSSKAVAAGFLVAMKTPGEPGGLTPVVLTSSHFLKTVGTKGLVMPLRVMDEKGNISLVYTGVVPKKGVSWYVKHPSLDIAAFELPLPSDLATPVYLPLVEESDFELKKTPRAGDDVSFAGFPDGLPSSEGLFPVLRRGQVASLDQSTFGSPYFLINGDVFSGDSGAPVFRAGTKRPRVTGMVIERLVSDDGQSMPIAVAVDAKGLRETLALLAKQKK